MNNKFNNEYGTGCSKHGLVWIRTFPMGRPCCFHSAAVHSQGEFCEIFPKTMNTILFFVLNVRNILEEKHWMLETWQNSVRAAWIVPRFFSLPSSQRVCALWMILETECCSSNEANLTIKINCEAPCLLWDLFWNVGVCLWCKRCVINSCAINSD